MKMVRSLLLGSAAALIAVGGAQAEGARGKPVQYVKICDLYGNGFYYLPGTDICVKLGGYVRAEMAYPNHSQTFPSDIIGTGAGRNNRIDTVRPEHTPEAMGRLPRIDDHGVEVYVYRRAGQACHVCDTTIRTEVLSAHNLFWCPSCQASPRTPAR